MKFVRIGEDFQEYGRAIPETMLTEVIKQTETYQTFIKYSIGLIPPKKSRGKGSQGKKSAVTPKPASIEVFDKSEPEPARRQTGSRRKSQSLLTTTSFLNQMLLWNPEPGRRRPSGIAFRDTSSVSKKIAPGPSQKLKGILTLTVEEQLVADTMQALKASRSQPLTRGSSEGTDVSLGVPDESTVILTTSSEGTEEESEYPEEETADEEVKWLYYDEEEEKKDNDKDYRSIDIEKTDDDEETNDEFVHGDEYVHDDVDKEIKDAEVVVTGKDDQEIIILSVSFGFGKQFLAHSSGISLTGTLKDTVIAEINSLLDIQIQQEVPRIHSPSILTVPVLVIPEPTVLLPIPEIPIVTSATAHPPPHSVSTITHVLQQTSTPIPTPPITIEAPHVTTTLDPLHAIAQRVYVLEKDVQELKQVDYSVVLAESIRSQVPYVVKEYIGSSLGDALQKTKQETAAKENIPKFSVTPYDQATEVEFKQKEILFKMMMESKSYGKHPKHR
ncbi:hypothetical protein Tco_0943609 [Tanacetum coccineum]